MDMTMLDVTHIADVKEGDEVIVLEKDFLFRFWQKALAPFLMR